VPGRVIDQNICVAVENYLLGLPY